MEQKPKDINVRQSLPVPIYEILKFTRDTQIGYPILAGGYCANILGLTNAYGDIDLYIFVSRVSRDDIDSIDIIHNFITGEYLTNVLKNVNMFVSWKHPHPDINNYRRLCGIKRIYKIFTKETIINICDIILVTFRDYHDSTSIPYQSFSKHLQTLRTHYFLPSPDVLDVPRCINTLIYEFDIDVCRCVALPHDEYSTLYMKVFDLRITYRHPLYEALDNLMFARFWPFQTHRILKYISRTAVWSTHQFKDLINSTHYLHRLSACARCIRYHQEKGNIDYNSYIYSIARQKYLRNRHYQNVDHIKQQTLYTLIERDFPTIISSIYKYTVEENVGLIFLAGAYCARLLGLTKYPNPVNVFWVIVTKTDENKIYKFLDDSDIFVRCYKNPEPLLINSKRIKRAYNFLSTCNVFIIDKSRPDEICSCSIPYISKHVNANTDPPDGHDNGYRYDLDQFSITIASVLQNFKLDMCRCIAVPKPLSKFMIVYDVRFSGNHPFFDGVWNILSLNLSEITEEDVDDEDLLYPNTIDCLEACCKYVANTPWNPDRFVTYNRDDIGHLINNIDKCCYTCMYLDGIEH